MLEDVNIKVMKRISDGLKNSDKMLLKLEEKHLKFEEQKNIKRENSSLR